MVLEAIGYFVIIVLSLPHDYYWKGPQINIGIFIHSKPIMALV